MAFPIRDLRCYYIWF